LFYIGLRIGVSSQRKNSLGVPENNMMRRMLEPREEIARIWRELSNEVKVKLSLCLTTQYAMKAYWGVEV
jgi:hypothetical protein